jgi:hypothetical protein
VKKKSEKAGRDSSNQDLSSPSNGKKWNKQTTYK